eukprot:1189358-Prorocentrum_minimum.AAC.2
MIECANASDSDTICYLADDLASAGSPEAAMVTNPVFAQEDQDAGEGQRTDTHGGRGCAGRSLLQHVSQGARRYTYIKNTLPRAYRLKTLRLNGWLHQPKISGRCFLAHLRALTTNNTTITPLPNTVAATNPLRAPHLRALHHSSHCRQSPSRRKDSLKGVGDAFTRGRRIFARDGAPTGGDADIGTGEIALEILPARVDGGGQPVTESADAPADAQSENERKAKAFPADGGGWGALC